MRQSLFDLSVAASKDLSLVPKLIQRLKKRKLLTPTETEPIAALFYYRDQTITRYLSSEMRDKHLKSDLRYWSDRWCASRAYTLNHLWILFFKDRQ